MLCIQSSYENFRRHFIWTWRLTKSSCCGPPCVCTDLVRTVSVIQVVVKLWLPHICYHENSTNVPKFPSLPFVRQRADLRGLVVAVVVVKYSVQRLTPHKIQTRKIYEICSMIVSSQVSKSWLIWIIQQTFRNSFQWNCSFVFQILGLAYTNKLAD